MMHSRETVVELNNTASDAIISQETLNTSLAELVLRNTAVITDRLQPAEFRQLRPTTINSVLDAANVAQLISPKDEDYAIPGEYRSDYTYRSSVYGPMHRLQSHVLNVSLSNQELSKKTAVQFRRAIWLASTAFEAIMHDPQSQDITELNRNLGYFASNAKAATPRGIEVY